MKIKARVVNSRVGPFVEYVVDNPLYPNQIESDKLLEVIYEEEIIEPDSAHVLYEVHEYYQVGFPGVKFIYRKEVSRFTLR